MEYKAIRKLLQQSFEASLAKHKADIDKNGRLSEKQKDGWKNTLFFMKTSIEDGKDAFMGDTFDQNVVEPPLQRILESHSVDIAVDSPDFAVMKQ